jgi:hypothetical protein
MKSLWMIVFLLCCGTFVSAQTAPAKRPSTHGIQLTTLFGVTLGLPEPEDHCYDGYDSSWPTGTESEEERNRASAAAQAVDACLEKKLGLAYLTTTRGPRVEKLGENVEVITVLWDPVYCDRVEKAVLAKFGAPSVSSWHGRNGFGIPISGKIWTWLRLNKDRIQWTRPSGENWPKCELYADTLKWRSQPKPKDHL